MAIVSTRRLLDLLHRYFSSRIGLGDLISDLFAQLMNSKIGVFYLI